MDTTKPMSPPAAALRLRQLVDRYRGLCLWFLRPDFYPTTAAETIRVLRYIQRRADRAGFLEASELLAWHSRPSNAPSARS